MRSRFLPSENLVFFVETSLLKFNLNIFSSSSTPPDFPSLSWNTFRRELGEKKIKCLCTGCTSEEEFLFSDSIFTGKSSFEKRVEFRSIAMMTSVIHLSCLIMIDGNSNLKEWVCLLNSLLILFSHTRCYHGVNNWSLIYSSFYEIPNRFISQPVRFLHPFPLTDSILKLTSVSLIFRYFLLQMM